MVAECHRLAGNHNSTALCHLRTFTSDKVTANGTRECFTFFAPWFGTRVRVCNLLTWPLSRGGAKQRLASRLKPQNHHTIAATVTSGGKR